MKKITIRIFDILFYRNFNNWSLVRSITRILINLLFILLITTTNWVFAKTLTTADIYDSLIEKWIIKESEKKLLKKHISRA